MSDVLSGELATTLIETAQARGYVVSRVQLRNWYDAKLLPQWNPPRKTLGYGLGKGKGKDAIYPPGTGEQLLALLAYREHHKLEALWRWHLWWNGYEIPTEMIRADLEEALSEWARTVEQMRDGDELSEKMFEAIEESETKRIAQPALRRARKRTGREYFPTYARISAEMLTGLFSGWADEDDPRIFARGLGLRSVGLVNSRDTSETLTEDAHTLAETVAIQSLTDAFVQADTNELIRARDELRTLLQMLDDARYLSEQMHGKKAKFAAVPRTNEMTHGEEKSYLLFWLALRRLPEFEEHFGILTGPASQLRAARQALEAMASKENPRQRLQPSGGATHGKDVSVCETSLHPPSPP